MSERKHYQPFKEKFLKRDPHAFIYKIPDTGALGGKKPFDTIVLSRGISICFELKSVGKNLTPYQKYQMDKFEKAGGIKFTWVEGEETLDELIDRMMLAIQTERR